MTIFLSNKIQGAGGVGAIGFDAITDWEVKESSKVSTEPVQDGSNVADNYFDDPIVASFSGVVTPWNFAGKGTKSTPEEFIRQVQLAKKSKTPFDVFLAKDLQPITNCLITDFSYSREAEVGDSIKITMSVQQIIKATKATEVDLNDLNLAPEVAEQGQDSTDNGDSQTKKYTVAVDRADAFVKVVTFDNTGGFAN